MQKITLKRKLCFWLPITFLSPIYIHSIFLEYRKKREKSSELPNTSRKGVIPWHVRGPAGAGAGMVKCCGCSEASTAPKCLRISEWHAQEANYFPLDPKYSMDMDIYSPKIFIGNKKKQQKTLFVEFFLLFGY